MKLFYTESYKYLADKMKKSFELGKIERTTFSDGESYICFKENVKNEDVIILGGTTSDKEVLDLYDMACALSMYGANSINLIVPYFGYSTMERAVNKGEVVKAKTRARLFSSIPRAKELNTIYLLDLHVSGILHYFENDLHSVHIYGKSLIKKAISDINSKDLVIASPDEGRVKWVSSLAKEFNLPFAVALKDRDKEDISSLIAFGDVKGKDVLIYDDMIRSGNTIIEASKRFKKLGARKIYVMTTHGLFTSEAIFHCKDIEQVYASNSHPNTLKHKNKLQIIDISKLIIEVINENL